ncbi:PREDICTED: L-aminoadipate-semialdehyde dehydrogenase-phosphopantetheinyl transferase [Fragaria vesca subsp. vesca]|uniref:L-aminoadipate-semialdehyde dehydrogenase-phosphopantetheinyl transferase n=1 Tax=Fragaria vesca subsp. vesca TaxID=101020 RepID=UPI0002C31BE7|nr:PREDICTED: L-aminoadipate-semialdehyde dehydrogenase-phosphopantetheinyl transferase [Fragaria vesca subsp. vesca]
MFLFRRSVFLRMNIHGLPRNLCSAPSTLLPVQLPTRMESHLWYVVPEEVKSETLLKRYFQLLSPCEKKNVLRMRGDELQKRALLARALVRTTIARYTNDRVDPRSLNFKKNGYGKPEVDWKIEDDWQPPALHFNISHTSSLIACGVAFDSPIGIDVEEKQRKLKHHILAFARRYFSSHEVDHLTSISDFELQRHQFIKLWTLKEAYVKALGRGFSASPFKTFTIKLKAAAKRGIPESRDSKISEISVESLGSEDLTNNWQFLLLELAGSHYGAICMEKHNTLGEGNVPIKLTARRTIPLVEDEFVGTDAVVPIGGLTC